MHYVSTTERQIIKLSFKDVSHCNLNITIKAESNYLPYTIKIKLVKIQLTFISNSYVVTISSFTYSSWLIPIL